jgi:hypothetical protein
MAQFPIPRFNGGMHKPPSVFVSLGPSRIACGAIALLTIATSLVLLTMPLPFPVVLAASCALAGWAGNRLRVIGLRRGPRAVRDIRLEGDDAVTIGYGAGRSVTGVLRLSSSVGPRVTTLVWRPHGAHCSRAVLILPDMLSADAFRRLRVLMRYGRSDTSHGVPASQA